VIATRIMGIPELVEHGSTGLLVPPGRPAELVDALQTLARSPELRERLGAAGRERVLSEFSVERAGRRLQLLFLSTIGPCRPHSRRRSVQAAPGPELAEQNRLT
jgi:glycosyltransferase involved in cell wall biosynthesis